jgi:site-specific recombinase XerD
MATQVVRISEAGVSGMDPRPVGCPARSRMVYLEPPELLAVLRAARQRSTRDWAMILIAYRHGLRASEVCDLRIADVDLKTRQVSLRRLKGSLSTVQPIERHRGQPLLDEFQALTTWLRQRQGDGSEFLFLSQKGGGLGRTQFFRIFKACAEVAGLPAKTCHPHALKHSLATHLISENVNLAWVKQCLGHKAIGSTMKYVAVSDSRAADGAQAALMRVF